MVNGTTPDGNSLHTNGQRGEMMDDGSSTGEQTGDYRKWNI